VEKILVAGIDTVVGANLAVSLSENCTVLGLSFSEQISLAECETAVCPYQNIDSVRKWVSSIQPDRILYCGPNSKSAWELEQADFEPREVLQDAKHWARIAGEMCVDYTLISSDAVFTGPWMFHDERGNCFSPEASAATIREVEERTTQFCPDALLVRTHAFGWSPDRSVNSWVEKLHEELESETTDSFDYNSHASPLLVSDLAEILEKAWEAHLSGLFHVAGAERVNPNQFAQQFASTFGLPAPPPVDGNRMISENEDVRKRETSLQTLKIRKTLGIRVPVLAEGLRRLKKQRESGYRDKLCAKPVHEKVA